MHDAYTKQFDAHPMVIYENKNCHRALANRIRNQWHKYHDFLSQQLYLSLSDSHYVHGLGYTFITWLQSKFDKLNDICVSNLVGIHKILLFYFI